MPYLVEGAARLDYSNTPGSRPDGAPDNGQVLIQQADGVLLTRRRDGTMRETDLRTMQEQIASGPLRTALDGRAALGVTVGPDSDYLIPVGAVHVVIPRLTGSRTYRLPSVVLYPYGQDLVIIDEGRYLGTGPVLTVASLVGIGDAIPPYPNNQIALAVAGASVRLRRGALSNVWSIV